MSKLNPSLPSQGDGDPKQPVILGRSLYGAVLQRYNVGQYPDFIDKTKQVERVTFSFVTLFDAANLALPRASRATKSVNNKLFWDPTKDMKSGLFEVLSALLDGKMTPEQIKAGGPEALPDMDDLIGRPVSLMLEPSKPARNGITYNNVKGIYAASPALKQAVRDIYKTFETKIDDTSKNKYLASPKPEYEEGPAGAAAAQDQSTEYYDSDSTIPF